MKENIVKHNMKILLSTTHNYLTIFKYSYLLFLLLPALSFFPGCYNIPYENASLNGCYSLENNEVFQQFWFDGAEEFLEIYWTPISGTVTYGGTYIVGQGELELDYYEYNPEYYDLIIYPNGITLNGDPYYYTGTECS